MKSFSLSCPDKLSGINDFSCWWDLRWSNTKASLQNVEKGKLSLSSYVAHVNNCQRINVASYCVSWLLWTKFWTNLNPFLPCNKHQKLHLHQISKKGKYLLTICWHLRNIRHTKQVSFQEIYFLPKSDAKKLHRVFTRFCSIINFHRCFLFDWNIFLLGPLTGSFLPRILGTEHNITKYVDIRAHNINNYLSISISICLYQVHVLW